MTKKKNTKTFIQESKQIFGDKFEYTNTKYTNAKTNVKIYCTHHQYEFTIAPNNHLKSKDGCNSACKKYGKGLKRKQESEHCQKEGLIYKKHKCSRCKCEMDDFFKNKHDDCKRKDKTNYENRKTGNDNSDLGENWVYQTCVYITKGGPQCTLSGEVYSEYCKLHAEYVKNGVNSTNRCLDCGNKKENLEKRLCDKCNTMRNDKNHKKRKIVKQEKINKPLGTLDKYEISPYYVSGFFDGDGSICITQGLSLQIMFSQCVRSVLLKFQKIFGGSIYKRDMSHEPNRRDQYSLRLCGKDCEKMLKYLFVGSIMKFEQVKVGMKFLNVVNLHDLEDKKITMREQMRKLNKSYKKTHNKPYDRINWEYMSGLFDAEGCIYLKQITRKDKSLRHAFCYMKISQKNDYKLLDAIREFTGHGRTKDKTSWTVDRMDFTEYDLKQFLPHLIVKKEQAEMCLELFDCKDKDRRKEIYEVVKFLKKIDNTIV